MSALGERRRKRGKRSGPGLTQNGQWAHFHPNAKWIVKAWCKMIATIRALRVVSGPLSTNCTSHLLRREPFERTPLNLTCKR
jgi:hypothetical protein